MQRWRLTLWILFGTAFAVRALYLFESSDQPAFWIPILDEGLYHARAKTLLIEGRASEEFFFQSPFYPTFLAGMYRFVSESTLVVKIVQMAIDSLTCVLVAVLGSRVFERRVGSLAGFLCALYGPQIFEAGQLMPTAWVCFWVVSFLLLVHSADSKPSVGKLGILGLVAGLGSLTHALMAPAALSVSVVLLVRLARRPELREERLRFGLAWALGASLVLLPAMGEQKAAAASASALPTSSGLNFYIGNNENRCTTINTRGGYGWQLLLEEPFRKDPNLPYVDASVSDYYYDKAFEFLREHPLRFLEGLALKAAQLLQSQESPRTFDLYVFQEWSLVLSVLAPRLGPFGFPFGVLLPLALFGALTQRKRVPWFLATFALVYVALMVLVFVTARYRVPLVPLMAPLAALGALRAVELLRGKGERRDVRMPLGVSAAAVVVSVLPTIECETSMNLKAEIYQAVGTHYMDAGSLEQAAPYLRQAVELAPAYGEAQFNLGLLELKQGNVESAAEHVETTLQIYPGYPPALKNRGLILLQRGAFEEAHAELVKASRRGAVEPDEFASIGITLLNKNHPAAPRFLMSAVQDGTTRKEAYVTLGAIAVERGELLSAHKIYERGIRAHPDFAYFYFSLAELQARARDWAGAVATLELLRARNVSDPRLDELLGRYRAELAGAAPKTP